MKMTTSATSDVAMRHDRIHYFIYLNPQTFLQNNPFCTELLQQYAAILPTTNVCTILVTPDVPLPDIAVGTVLVSDLPTPCSEELEEVLSRCVKDAAADKSTFPQGSKLSDTDVKKISNLGLGLSLQEFETYVALSIIEASLTLR